MPGKNKYVYLAKEIILNLIDKNTVTVFLFGSRACNNQRYSSDIDIGLLAKKRIDEKLLSDINNSIEDSIIPYHVDVIDFNNVDDNFRKVALKNIEVWNKAKDIDIN